MSEKVEDARQDWSMEFEDWIDAGEGAVVGIGHLHA